MREKMKRRKYLVVIGCVIAGGLLYIASFFIVWQPLSAADSRNVEFLPSGRRPVIGPEPRGWVRLVCPPRGTGFLFAKDYTGDEWVFKAYKPLLQAWANVRGFEIVNE